MDFKVGDIVFYDWVGKAEEAEIIKCYPKTDRYRIRLRIKDSFELNANVSEVFITENAFWQSRINRINDEIKALEEKHDEYTGKIVEHHILNK